MKASNLGFRRAHAVGVGVVWGLVWAATLGGCGGKTTDDEAGDSASDGGRGGMGAGAGGVGASGGDSVAVGGTGVGVAGATGSAGASTGGSTAGCRVAPCPPGTILDSSSCGCITPLCESNADCALLSDCCNCEAHHVDAPLVGCMADCSIEMCDIIGGPGGMAARCVAGKCGTVHTGSCDATFCPSDDGQACCVSPYGPCGHVSTSGTGMCVSPNPCQEPIDPGPCLAAFPRFAYDPGTGTCVSFMWGGCAGTQNNFETLEACEAACP